MFLMLEKDDIMPCGLGFSHLTSIFAYVYADVIMLAEQWVSD